jgi:predicted ester cyclase
LHSKYILGHFYKLTPMKPQHPPAHPLKGFDTEFNDLDHYIRVITDRIWEGRRINDILTYYSDPCVVETPSSVSTDVMDVIKGTEATLQSFPDRRLLAEDVIQSGEATGGFLSSHRIISTMTHLGDGAFGPATGRKIQVRTIADCVCQDNRIIHEWLVRDQAAIALQIGLTPREVAQRWLNKSGTGQWQKPIAPPPPPSYQSHVSTASLAQHYATAIAGFAHQQADVSQQTHQFYDDAVHHIGPGATTYFGQAEVGAYWATLFATFAVQSWSVEHLVLQSGDGRADRVAMRWRAQTLHRGDGIFGVATGKPVEIMGICHAEFYRGRVLREWVLVDDIALWMQVLAASAAPQAV